MLSERLFISWDSEVRSLFVDEGMELAGLECSETDTEELWFSMMR